MPTLGILEDKLARNFLRAVAGFFLLFLYHIPRIVYLALQISYSHVFEYRPTLTADPKEHLKRARAILKRGRLSELLYAALEIRFALERMAQWELIFCSSVSSRMLKEHDPVKKISNLNRIDADTALNHNIYFVDKTSGKRFKWAEYKPMDRGKIANIQGRLGDLLHPKEGLHLGIPVDPWYLETKAFLWDAIKYLSSVAEDNVHFFAYKGFDQFELVRNDKG
jgi:hypothetical protein